MMATISGQQGSIKSSIKKALRLIEEFRKLDSEMQMQKAMIFLLVAENEGLNNRDLERLTGLSDAAASRNVAALTKWKNEAKGIQGHDLIVRKPQIEDRRTYGLYLTPKGRAVLNSVLENFE